MKLFPPKSHSTYKHYLLVGLFLLPLIYGMNEFIWICHWAIDHPDVVLDSPLTVEIYLIYALLFITPSLLAIIVLLLKSKKPDPAETGIPDRE